MAEREKWAGGPRAREAAEAPGPRSVGFSMVNSRELRGRDF